MAKGGISEPLISICIPAYNVERYVAETLNAFSNQVYKNIEVIIVDDGSTDNTTRLISGFNNSRVKLIRSANGGAASARNLAYQHSTGDYVIFFDADDHIEPDFILKQYEKVKGSDDVVALSAWGRFYNNDLRTFKADQVFESCNMTMHDWVNLYWYKAKPMTTPGRIIIPKRLIEEAGLWDETLSLNDDLEFYTRIFLKAKKMIINPEAVYYYRSGVSGLSGKKSLAAYQSLYRSIELSTELVLSHFKNDVSIKQSCANLWQSIIYELYPQEKELARQAETQVSLLIKPDLKFPAGGSTKYMAMLLGWKLTKKLKALF